MIKQLCQAGLLAGMFTSMASANVLNTAEALWKFDAADSGTASAGQILDSSPNGHHATSVTNADLLNWTTVPATGPGGALAVGPDNRGLAFNPEVVTPGTPDEIRNTGFKVSNFSVTGSATLITRFRWDGYMDSTTDMGWLYKNGLGAQNVGWMFGVRGNKLSIHQNGASYDEGTLQLQTGSWYDVAVVFENDLADEANDKITYYFIKDGETLKIASRNVRVSDDANAETLVGSEILGQGSGNQRKAFDGVVDYIAVWDTALSDADVRGILIPEPAAMSAGLTMLLVMAGRRTRR